MDFDLKFWLLNGCCLASCAGCDNLKMSVTLHDAYMCTSAMEPTVGKPLS